jgi:hypothetical protein
MAVQQTQLRALHFTVFKLLWEGTKPFEVPYLATCLVVRSNGNGQRVDNADQAQLLGYAKVYTDALK